MKANADLPLPEPPGPWVNESRCVCGAHLADYKRSRFGVTWDQGVDLLRTVNAAAEQQGELPGIGGSPDDPGAGFRSRGPVLWAMRVLKMERWYAAHATCGGAWYSEPDPDRDLDRDPLLPSELWGHAVADDLDRAQSLAESLLDDESGIGDLIAELRGRADLGVHPLADVLRLDHDGDDDDDRIEVLRILLPDLAAELPHVVDPSRESEWLTGYAARLGAESTLDELLEQLDPDQVPF